MISNIKKKLIIPLIILTVLLSSVVFSFGVTYIPWESTFMPFLVNQPTPQMNGDVLSLGNIGSSNWPTITFYSLEASKTYTAYYFEAPAEVPNTQYQTLSINVGGGVKNVEIGTLSLDGVKSVSYTTTTQTNFRAWANLCESPEYIKYVSFTTPADVYNSTYDVNGAYFNISNIHSGFSNTTIDFSKLFIEEGSIDDLIAGLIPYPTLVNQNITVMPGYVLVADIGQSSTGTVHFAASGLPSSPNFLSANKVWQTSVQYGQSLTIPSIGPISSSAFLTHVTWQPVNSNLLGVATIGRADILYNSSNGRYFTVVNPYQYMIEDGGGIKGYHTELNPPVTVAFSSGVYTYRLYKTSQLWNDVNITGSTYFTPTLNDTGTEVITYEEVSITDDTIVNEVPADSLPSGSISGSDGSVNISLGGSSDIFGKSANNLQSAYSENSNFVNAIGTWLRVFPAEIWSVLLTTALVICGIAIVKAIL